MNSNYTDAKRVDEEIAKLNIEKNLILESQLKSNRAEDIFKAQSYLQEVEKNTAKKRDIRSFLFDPFDAYYTTGGYKQQRKRVSFDVLKKVGDTPIVGSIINTRVFQIQNFLRFTENDKEEGFTIRKKRSLFEPHVKSDKLKDEEKKTIEYIVSFLENGGLKSKWDINDDLHDFVRKVMRDSLSYDQLTAECERNRRFELIGFTAVDGSTIRILETVDPRFRVQSEQKYKIQFGQLPRYAQVYQGNVMKNEFTKDEIVYYPWELMYAQRNKTSQIDKNGYGTSEIEVLLDIVTWSLWGMQYNGNFFKQGSNPKGFINLKDGGANMDIVNDFRQTWRQMIAGVNNSHKIPVFSGIDLEWIDLQGSNKDMEFQQWMEFLIIMLCSVYTIDPSELGYQFQKQAQIFGQAGQKERIQHSKKKGLKPLLIFLEKVLTKWIVSELDSDYELKFTGIDNTDEAEIIDMIKKKLDAGVVSFESEFEKEMGRPYDPQKDTILNPTFIQAQQMKQFGGQDNNAAVDEMTGESDVGASNPFDQYGVDGNPIGGGKTPQNVLKSLESDPILSQAMKYIEDNLNID
jgi:hypothetical protein